MIKLVDPLYFVDFDRLDFMCKYLYIKSKDYRKYYEEHILKQTSGIEPFDSHIPMQKPKNTIQDYVDSFDRLIENFKTEGYNHDYPIYSNSLKRIDSGAHRIACSIYFNQKIPTIISDSKLPKGMWGREWYEKHGFCEDHILELEETVRECLNQ